MPPPKHVPEMVVVSAKNAPMTMTELISPSSRIAATRRPTTSVGFNPVPFPLEFRASVCPLARIRQPSGAPMSCHAHRLVAHGHHVARVELAAAALLVLAVHRHAALGEQRLRLGPGVREAGELEQLAEPDHVAADLDLAHRAGR